MFPLPSSLASRCLRRFEVRFYYFLRVEEYIRSGRDKSIVDPDPSGHARGFLSEYDYTEGFTGKKVDWLIYQGPSRT